MNNCATCRYWKRLPADFRASLVAGLKTPDEAEMPENVDAWGQCRRNAPKLTEYLPKRGSRDRTVTVTEFPDMPGTGWCGQWEDRA